MADISPINTRLNDVMEGENISLIFTPVLGPDETLTSINIIDSPVVDGIIVEDNKVNGSYNNIFDLGNDSLMYRDGDEFKSASSWDDLPDKNTVDLYLWKAPSVLEKTYSYDVKMDYVLKDSTAEPPTSTLKTMTKTYRQTVKGNWDIWARKLRNYVVR